MTTCTTYCNMIILFFNFEILRKKESKKIRFHKKDIIIIKVRENNNKKLNMLGGCFKIGNYATKTMKLVLWTEK